MLARSLEKLLDNSERDGHPWKLKVCEQPSLELQLTMMYTIIDHDWYQPIRFNLNCEEAA